MVKNQNYSDYPRHVDSPTSKATSMKRLENELEDLRTMVSQMGSLTEKMVFRVADEIRGVGQGDIYDEVIRHEEQLDNMQLEVDREAVRILTVYAPVASDLRFVLSVTRVSAELERIGDQAKNICGNLELMRTKGIATAIPQVRKMAEEVCEMVQNAMDAFVKNDSRKARATISCDDLVDALNDQVMEELLNDDVVRRGIEEPLDMAGTMAQILLSRSLERVGDQATNICEEVVYMVKGDDIRHQ